MTSPLPSVPTQEPERAELPFASSIVEELLRMFVRAVRAHQLYLPNNPIYKGALDALRAAFAPVWERTDELVLAITESDLRWYDQVILEEPARSTDSLPWLFFKDGVREVRFLRGFDDEELGKLLEIVQRLRKAAPDEDDLLSMLWEADFLFLRYRYVDLGLEPAPAVEDGGEVTHEDSEQGVAAAAREAAQESRASGIVNMADFDSTLYFLDEREIDYLQAEVRREYEQDLRQNVVAMLLDIFETQRDAQVRSEVMDHLETMLVYMLAAAHFRGVAYLLRESAGALQRAQELLPEQQERLANLPARLSAPESLAQMLQALDDSPELPPSDELIDLFQQLRPVALGTIFTWLGRIQNAALRPLIEDAAGRLASTATAELVRLILVPEREVAIEAIRRAGALKTPAAVAPLGKLLSDPDAELRLASVRALHEIGSAGALQALERAVEDDDREVRIAAVRALGGRGYRPVLPRVESRVKGKTIREADLTEKMAFFEAYGALCGDAGVGYLDSLLNGKGFLGRREDAEVRACAAIALGRIGTGGAAESLRKASGEKDVVVRNAVTRALRGTGGA